MFPLLFLKRFFHRIYHKYMLIDFSPIALFLILGLLLFVWGMLFGSYLWIKAIITKTDTPLGTLMLVVVPLILGFQLLLQAIVLDIQETKKWTIAYRFQYTYYSQLLLSSFTLKQQLNSFLFFVPPIHSLLYDNVRETRIEGH